MSIAIKLDRPALRALIDSDPEFKLELQRAVLSEVVKNLFESDIRKILEVGDKAFLKQITEVIAEDTAIMANLHNQVEALLTVKQNPGYYASSVKLRPEVQQVVDAAAQDFVAKATRIDSAVMDQAQAKIDAMFVERPLEDRIAARVNRLVDDNINKLVDAKVRERLNAIASGITA